MARRRGLVLSAPTIIVFVIAVALIAFGAISYYTDLIDVDVDSSVLSLTIGGGLLTLANLIKNL